MDAFVVERAADAWRVTLVANERTLQFGVELPWNGPRHAFFYRARCTDKYGVMTDAGFVGTPEQREACLEHIVGDVIAQIRHLEHISEYYCGWYLSARHATPSGLDEYDVWTHTLAVRALYKEATVAARHVD